MKKYIFEKMKKVVITKPIEPRLADFMDFEKFRFVKV